MKTAIPTILCTSLVIALSEESNLTLLNHLTGKMGGVVTCMKGDRTVESPPYSSQKLVLPDQTLLKSLAVVVTNSKKDFICSGAVVSMYSIAIPKEIWKDYAHKIELTANIQDHQLRQNPTVHKLKEIEEIIGAKMDIYIILLLEPIALHDYGICDKRSAALRNSPFAQPEYKPGYYGVSVFKNSENQMWKIALREYQVLMILNVTIIAQVRKESERFFQKSLGDPLYYGNKLVGLYKEDITDAPHHLSYMRILKEVDSETSI